MSFKEWTAVVQLVGVGIIGWWLGNEAVGGGFAGLGFAAVAMKLLWAIGAVIVFTIIGIIVTVIVVSIVRREEVKDEAADERDRLVEAKSGRNAYVATSIGGMLGLVALALGADPAIAVYMLFGASLVGGGIDAASRLLYYRLG